MTRKPTTKQCFTCYGDVRSTCLL